MLTFSFVLLVWVTFVSLAAILCNALALPLLRVAEGVSPGLRSQLLLAFIVAPWLIGTSVLVSSLADIFFGDCDINVCLWNSDPRRVNAIRSLVIVPLCVATFAWTCRALLGGMLARRALRLIDRGSDMRAEQDLRIVDSGRTLAFAGGGRVYVSRDLEAALPAEQFRAVILHERAHLRRRDGLFQLVAAIASACYLPLIRGRLLRALALANEQACDAQAAASVGAVHVASAILSVERMMPVQVAAMQPNFADGFVQARVQRLLDRSPPRVDFGALRITVVATALLGFLVCDLLYYAAMAILYPRF